MIEQQGAVSTVYYDVFPGWELWTLHTSDNHFDSIYCNRETMRNDFDEARRRNAQINIYGDWFDAMQGRFDPRRAMAELRPEYRTDAYYDKVVDDSAQWLEDYAPLLDVMADGNHELSILKNASTNLMDRLVMLLRMTAKSGAVHGGYGGWIRYMFNMSDGKATGPRTSIKLKYFHGAGGDAPVTRGAIQTNRQAVYLPDANIIINGHSHNAYYIPIQRERISNKGAQYFDTQHHIRIPGYKQGYGDGTTGWEVTRGGVPKPLGSFWTRFYCEDNQVKIQVIPQLSDPVPVHVDAEAIYDGRVYEDDRELE